MNAVQRPFPHFSRVHLEGAVLLLILPCLLFPGWRWWATAVALLLLALFFLLPLFTRRHDAVPSTPLTVVWLAWWLCVLVGVLVSADPDLTLPKVTVLLLGYAGWSYLTRVVSDRFSLTLAFLFWGALGLAFATVGLLSAAWLDKIPGLTAVLSLLPTQILQLPGSDSGVQPNQLAGTLLLYWPFLLSLLIGWRPASHPKLALAVTAVLTLLTTLLLLLTQSRSGWIGASGGVLALLGLWFVLSPPSLRRRRMAAAILTILLVVVGFVAWVGPTNLSQMWADPSQLGQTAVGSFGSLSFRQEVWRWAITAVSDFPFTGTGLGTFRHVARRLYPLTVDPDYDIAHAHNIFLQTALDVGLPGLIVYLALLLIVLLMGWQIARRSANYRPFALGLLASLVALHIYGLTDALALGSKTTLSFWLIISLLTSLYRLSTEAN